MVGDSVLEEVGGVPASDPRPAVLFFTHRVPYPPDKGDRIRTFQVLRTLAGEAAVHLACLADEPVNGAALAALKPYCTRVAIARIGLGRWLMAAVSLATGGTATEGAFRSKGMERLLARWAQQVTFRTAVISASGLVPYLRASALRDVPSVVDLMDVDSQKWFDYAAAGRIPRSWLYRLEGHRLRRVERVLPEWARAITLVSEAEVELYRRRCATGPVHAITNGVDLEYFRPRSAATTRGCVFVGSLDYRPNVDGICWFCDEAWPEIRRRHPRTTLTLVGRRPSPAVRRLAGRPGIELVGPVPDVRPYVAGAAVVVAPLRLARGVQNKILEALAMGKAVVASPQALEGLKTEPGGELLVAGCAAEWVEAVLLLLANPDLRASLGAAGRSYAEQYHRWESCLAPFRTLLDGAGGPDMAPGNHAGGTAPPP